MSATETAEEEAWTIGRVLRWTQQRFTARGIPSPRLDAELLLAHTLEKPRVALYTHFDQVLDKDTLGRFRELIKRRMAGSPVAYLTGEKEFFGLPLRVTEAVLIPRPDTEILVEQALELLPKKRGAEAAPANEDAPAPIAQAERGVELTVDYDEPADEPVVEPVEEAETTDETATLKKPAEPAAPAAPEPIIATVAEVGVGSGAVSLAIAHRRRDVKVIAIDASPAALEVARKNAERLNLSVEFHHGDLLSPLPASGRLELIVANLPYIPTAEIAGLSPEVRSEPYQALDGGPDGLDIIRRLVKQAGAYLAPGGSILLEVGDGQAPAVEDLLRAARFTDVRSAQDLSQVARVVIGRRAS